MAHLFNKKIKYENCLLILMAVFLVIVGLTTLINRRVVEGITLIPNCLFHTPLVILGSILLLFEVVCLCVKNEYLVKVKRIVFYITLLITIYYLLEIVVVTIVRNYITATTLTERPTTDESLLLRLCYLWHVKYKEILIGVWTTIWLSLAGTIIGLVLGLLFVSLRTLEITSRDNEVISFVKKISSSLVQIYVNVFRGTPMMVQAIIIYYFLPGVLAMLFKVDIQIINAIFSVGVTGLITVSLNTAAYLTEVLRGGIESLNKGQMEAARSLGMNRMQAMLYVIFPQGVKNSLPAICNEFIINIKDTSVLSVISVMDLFFVIDTINKRYSIQDGIFIAAIIYLCLTMGISKLLSLIEKRMNLVSKPLPSCN